eukprot:355018-Chlamydomonas_euryale.AAC.2
MELQEGGEKGGAGAEGRCGWICRREGKKEGGRESERVRGWEGVRGMKFAGEKVGGEERGRG